MSKVKSPEEFAEYFKKDVKKKCSKFKTQLIGKLEELKVSEPEDFSELVRAKVENDGVSYSALKRFRESPLSYVNYLIEPFEKTPAMLLGDLVDVLVTQPDKFFESFFIIPEEINRRSNEGKGLYLAYLKEADGRVIIENEMFEKAVKMVEALLKNKDTLFYLDRAVKKQEWINFVHPETGLKCRGIIDLESEEEPATYSHFIADLKTAASADEDEFGRQAYKLWYNGQFGFYTLGYKVKKFQFPEFYHIVVESSAPYNTNVFRVDPEEIKEAQKEVHNTLMAFKFCLDNNLWHKSYGWLRREVHYTSLKKPGYYKPKF